jgi:hypothetical protein
VNIITRRAVETPGLFLGAYTGTANSHSTTLRYGGGAGANHYRLTGKFEETDGNRGREDGSQLPIEEWHDVIGDATLGVPPIVLMRESLEGLAGNGLLKVSPETFPINTSKVSVAKVPKALAIFCGCRSNYEPNALRLDCQNDEVEISFPAFMAAWVRLETFNWS